MVTFWEVAAHSDSRMFSVCIFVILVISLVCFKGETLVLIASVPDHCLPFYLWLKLSCRGRENPGSEIMSPGFQRV